MAALNPNWPVMDYAVCWAAGRSANSATQDLWSSVTERTEGQVGITRGKTYELDQVQPGEATVTLRNDDGVFDPGNTASPFYGYVIPYRLMRIRAQWAPTVNMLTADQATALYASVGAYTGANLPQWVAQVGAQPLTIINSGTTNAYKVAYAASAATGQGYQVGGFSVAPGDVYSVQVQAKLSAAVTMSAQVSIVWYRADGTVLTTTLGTATALGTTNSALTVTATAPSLACGARVMVLNTTSPASAVSLQATLMQVEEAAAPSTWVQPGTWYYMFVGYVEAWPEGWSSAGNYGTVSLTAVDLFAFLSTVPLADPFVMDVLALNPNFYYPLNEGKASPVFRDLTGKRGNASLYVPATTALTSGNSIASADNGPNGTNGEPLTGAFLGASGPVMTSVAGSPRVINGVTYGPSNGGALSIPPDASGNIGTPVSGAWTRVIAAKAELGQSIALVNGSAYLWAFTGAIGSGDPQNNGVAIYIQGNTSPYQMTIAMTNTANGAMPTTYTFPGLGNQTSTSAIITDGDWHLYLVAYDPSTATLTLGVDGRIQSHNLGLDYGPDAFSRNNLALWNDLVGELVFPLPPYPQAQWIGDLAHYMEFGSVLSAAQFAALNESWRNAWAYNPNNLTETSDVRYGRILSWLGYVGPTRISAGACLKYGPATDIVGGSSPTMGLAALQNVVETESGQHYVAADGTVVFQSRNDRFTKQPTVTFGENTGEVAYLDATIDNDPTLVGNSAQVSAQFGSAIYTAEDVASENAYGQIGLTRTVNSMDQYELTAAPEYLVYVYKQPTQRLEALPVDVGANPSYWPTLLGLDLGACVQVNRRPSAAPNTISVPGFLEQIVWTLGDDGSAQWAGQITNNAQHQFCKLDDSTYGLLDSTAILGF